MSCWIPGPWEEAWVVGLKMKRDRERAAAAEQAAVPDKLEPPVKKRRGRKPATALAATEECPLPPAPPVEQCPMPTPKPA